MYRRAEDEAVGLLRLLCKFVDRAAEDALARLRAAAARDAAADRLVAEGFDAATVQRVLSTVRATAFKRALEPPFPDAAFYA